MNLKFLIFCLFFHFIETYSNYSDRAKFIINTIDVKVINITHKKYTISTEGLIISKNGNYLYESGGLYMNSSIRKIAYPSLKLEIEKKLSDFYYGKGIALCGEFLYQITWREEEILKYDPENLDFLGKIKIDENLREGSGIAYFKNNILLASDGSSEIFFLKCKENLKIKKRIQVKENHIHLNKLGDLTYVDEYIYAIRYFDDYLYKINPNNGNVEKKWNMKILKENEIRMGTLDEIEYSNGNVLNSITYDENRKLFILTGKNWGFLYEVNLE